MSRSARRTGRRPAGPAGHAVALAALAALGALAALPAGPAPGHAQSGTVRYVDDTAGCEGQRPCYQAIQAAVDAAADGDVISVAAGRYTETVLAAGKGLAFQGPGVGDPSAAPDPDRHAVWVGRSGGQPGVALTVDAAGGDVAGVEVSGFRFISHTVGVWLAGRRVGDPVPPPPGRPAAAVDADVVDGRVADNHFSGVGAGAPGDAAVVAAWARDLAIVANHVRGGRDGIVVAGATRAAVADNTIDAVAGTAIHVRAHGDDVEIARNTLRTAGQRGIAVHDLGGQGLAGLGTDVTIVDNSVLGAGAEGIDVAVASGGRLDHVDLLLNRVIGAGAGAGTPRGAVALRGGGAGLTMVRVQGGTIEATRRPPGALGAGIYAERVLGAFEIADVTVVDGAGPGLQVVDIESMWLHRSTVAGNADGVRVVETAATAPGAVSDIKLGGFAGEGNTLAGNGGAALTLVNARAGAGTSHDVDATYNAWGTAYAPDIEALIQHRPDDAALGTVSYLPALGTPRQLKLAADPPQLVANGTAESTLTASLTDAAGRPAADGTLVWLGIEGGGTLEAPGARVEVEYAAGPGAVQRSGEWGEFDSATFGPFSGAGYLRSSQPGATLIWSFEGDAVLARYGQTVIGPGTFTARIDGRPVGTISTLGPRRAWVDRVLAAGLGAGTHVIELTVASGEVNADVLVAGLTTRMGKVVTRLRAGAAIGTGRIAAQGWGADGAPSATLDVPFTAGPPATLALTAGAASLAVGGETTTVTADVRDALGRPVPDRTEVRFSTDLGSVTPDRVLTQNGRAATVFASGVDIGVANVRAAAGDVADTRTIALTAGPPATVVISPAAPSLPANSTATTDLTIAVRDAFGHPVRDGTSVLVVTNLGTLDAMALTTTGGVARTRLRTGGVAGDAVVQASAGAASGQASIAFEALDIRITKSAEPQTVVVPGEAVTFTLRVENVGAGPVFDLDVADPLPSGLVSPTFRTAFFPPGPEIERLPDGPPYRFRVDQLRPGQVGLLTIGARIDTSLRWGPRNEVTNRATAGTPKAAERTPEDNVSSANLVVVPGAVVTVTVRGPDRLTVGGATGKVTARVTDRFGNPVANGTSVFFTTDLGAVAPAVSQTRNGTAETTLTTGDRTGLATVRAVSTGDRGGVVRVRFTAGPPQSLTLAAARPRLPVGGETTVVTATLRDAFGNGVEDALIGLSTTLGLLSVTEARADADGTVTSTLRAGIRTGTATVRATSGALGEALEIPFVPGPPASIELAVVPDAIRVGGEARAVARVADEFGNPSAGTTVAFDTDIGRLAARAAATDGRGEAVTTVAGTRPGSGLVRATVGALSDTGALTVEPARVWLPYAVRLRALRRR